MMEVKTDCVAVGDFGRTGSALARPFPDVCHDAQDFAAAIAALLKVVVYETESVRHRRDLGLAQAEAWRLALLMDCLELLGRDPRDCPIFIDVSRTVAQTTASLREEAFHRGVELVSSDIAPACTLQIHPGAISFILRSLVMSGLEASRQGDRLFVTLAEEKGEIVLTVADSREERQVKESIDLGATLAKIVVDRVSGHLETSATADGGTTARVNLPATSFVTPSIEGVRHLLQTRIGTDRARTVEP